MFLAVVITATIPSLTYHAFRLVLVNVRSKRQWSERLLWIRLLQQVRKVDKSLQDHVSNSIFQRCLVDLHYFGFRSLFHSFLDDQYATGSRHIVVWRIGENGRRITML